MPLKILKHQKILLQKNPDFSETWLHDTICNDLSALGLGEEVQVIAREREQPPGGRLDLLLADIEENTRYEVEVQLGPTDAGHIIRCIEYWDEERSRYPAYDHVAVLVAEDVTGRFLNVVRLLNGSIPIVVIQLDALETEGHGLVLRFTKVLDQRSLREDEAAEAGGAEVDRKWWEARKGEKSIAICDRLLDLANQGASPPFQLRFRKGHIGVTVSGSFFNFAVIWPKKSFAWIRVRISDPKPWAKRMEEAGFDCKINKRENAISLQFNEDRLGKGGDLLKDFLSQARAEYRS